MREWVGVFVNVSKFLAVSLARQGFEASTQGKGVRATSERLTETGFEQILQLASCTSQCLECYNFQQPRKCTLKTKYTKPFRCPLLNSLKSLLGIETLKKVVSRPWWILNSLKSLLGIETGKNTFPWSGIFLNSLKSLLGIETQKKGVLLWTVMVLNSLKSLLGIETGYYHWKLSVDLLNSLKSLLGIETP